jgi:hypothetical protein
VAGSLERRVSNLEDGGDKECPECGFDGDWRKADYEVVWDDLVVCDGRSDPYVPVEPVEPKRCEVCGRALEIIVTWDDADLLWLPWFREGR